SPARRVRDLMSWAQLDVQAAARALEVPEATIREWRSETGERAPRMVILALERLTEKWVGLFQ
ncbi:MAG TPA: hypothetical protein VGP20_00175, partial [Steroidobacteraceae bacterium]|nr:hypothetical protein [Steroidobacteraceae bacterium]